TAPPCPAGASPVLGGSGTEVDARAGMFTLGLLLYEMIAEAKANVDLAKANVEIVKLQAAVRQGRAQDLHKEDFFAARDAAQSRVNERKAEADKLRAEAEALRKQADDRAKDLPK